MTSFLDDRAAELSDALRARGLDGWLVYDFHQVNPMARRLLGRTGMLTRRIFLWLPADGAPRALVHRIDRPAIREFPGEVDVYTTWQDLHERLEVIASGRRIAVETSADNAVPYLDLVPAGVVELLTRLGASLESSAPLVTLFASCWSAAELEDHRRTAEILADTARRALARAVTEVGSVTELEIQRQVLEELGGHGLEWEDLPIVGFGAHAADPHYEPREGTSRVLEAGEVVLLDLWARPSPHTVWADQTWMAYSGPTPPAEVVHVWEAVRDARDAVVKRLREGWAARDTLTGAELDRASRGVITERGYAEYFGHRTGHSIDLDLHGSGPHLDDFETHDVRELATGVAFSIEPGVYLPDRFGVRSEINGVLLKDGPEFTPREFQRELILPG